MPIDIVTATPDDFRSHVGDTFTVQSVAGPVALTLDNVKIFEGSTVRDNRLTIDGRVLPARQAFALTFEGPRAPILASETFTITHATLGDMMLFLSPFRQDHACMLYEVVFN